jgi:hypothetical protein
MDDPKLIDHVNDFLGDFSKPYNHRAFLVAPFYRWIGHIAKLALVKAPAKYPGRTVLLGLLGQQGLELMKDQGLDYRQDVLGGLPIGEIPVAGGYAKRVLRTQAQNPLATAYQTFPFSESNTVDISGVLNTGNPLPIALAEWASGRNLSRMDIPDNRLRDEKGNPTGGFDPWVLASRVAQLAPLLNIISPGVGKADTSVPFVHERDRFIKPGRTRPPQRPNDAMNQFLRLFGITVDPIDVSGSAFQEQMYGLMNALAQEYAKREANG